MNHKEPHNQFRAQSPRPAKATDIEMVSGAVAYDLVEGEILSLPVGRCYPTPVQVVTAESLLRLLNAQIAHDGRWRVIWREPVKNKYDKSAGIFRPAYPTILQCQFLDKDGDVWCCVNIEEDVYEIIDAGISSYVEQCEEAYCFMHNMLFNVMDIRVGVDTKNVAKGEKLTENTDGILPPQT